MSTNNQKPTFIKYSSILGGISVILGVLGFLLRPTEQRDGPVYGNVITYISSIDENGFYHWIFMITQILFSLFLLAIIPYIRDTFSEEDRYLVEFSCNIGKFGAVFNFFWYVSIAGFTQIMIRSYEKTDPESHIIYETYGLFGYDPHGYFFAFFAIFFIIIGILALRSKKWPVGLSILGIIAGVGYSMVVVSLLVNITALRQLGALGVLALAGWFIWYAMIDD